MGCIIAQSAPCGVVLGTGLDTGEKQDRERLYRQSLRLDSLDESEMSKKLVLLERMTLYPDESPDTTMRSSSTAVCHVAAGSINADYVVRWPLHDTSHSTSLCACLRAIHIGMLKASSSAL